MRPHPEAEELIALQEARLDATRAEEVRRHLAECPSCREEMDRLEAFDLGGDDPATTDSADEAAASWQRFRERVEGAPPASRRPARRWTWWALGAALIGALIGALLVGLALSKPELDGLKRPFWVDLVPDDAPARRGAGSEQEVTVPMDAEVLVVRLLIGDQTVHPGYSVRLLDARRGVVWEQSDLRRQPSGAFVLLIPRRHLTQGRYRILLSPEPGGSAENVLASYSFRLRETA